MTRYFDQAKDFLNYRTNCVFCHSPLNPILTNFNSNIAGGIPSFKSRFKNNQFICDFSYTSAIQKINSKIILDIKKNKFIFKSKNISEAFRSARPHFELYCPKRSCKTKFYVSSDILNWDNKGNLSSVKLFYEAFNLDNFLWVQNDFFKNETSIFKNSPLTIPITVPMIPFDDLPKDELFKKMWTVITFA